MAREEKKNDGSRLKGIGEKLGPLTSTLDSQLNSFEAALQSAIMPLQQPGSFTAEKVRQFMTNVWQTQADLTTLKQTAHQIEQELQSLQEVFQSQKFSMQGPKSPHASFLRSGNLQQFLVERQFKAKETTETVEEVLAQFNNALANLQEEAERINQYFRYILKKAEKKPGFADEIANLFPSAQQKEWCKKQFLIGEIRFPLEFEYQGKGMSSHMEHHGLWS